MQVLRIQARSLLALALCGLFLVAGCEGGGGTEPVPVVYVTPAGVATLEVGDTLRVRAVVQNSSRTEVEFTSSAPAVASVTADGLVKALAAGEATITATSTHNGSASASLQVRVKPEETGSVFIQALINNLGQPVDPTRAQGVIFAQLEVDRGTASRLEVLVDTVVACQRTFATSSQSRFGEISLAAAAPLQCDINTAAFDSLTGTPRFYNGRAKLSARLVSADGRVLFTNGGPELVLTNTSRLIATVGATAQTNDAAGLRWLDGDVLASVLPVLYDRGTSLARVTAFYQKPGGPVISAVDTVAPFVPVLSDSLLRGVTDPALTLSIVSATRAGGVGPTTTSEPARYDNERPTAGRVTGREWVGAQYEFARSYIPEGEADRGVGRIHARFFALRGTSLPADTVVTRGKQVTRGADLDQAALGTYQLAALVCDGLENCVAVPGFSFGVDNTPPTLALPAEQPNRAINPGADLSLDPRDDFSGFEARPIEVTVQLLDADPSTPTCGPVVEGVDLPGKLLSTGACVADSVGSVVAVPRATPGYYSYALTPFDRAGNRGATAQVTYLVDQTPPTISFSPPAQLTPGEEFTASAEGRDNLDLTQLGFRLVFSTEDRLRSIGLPFAPDTTVGTAFDGTLTTTASASRRLPFVRTLTYATGTLPRVTVLVDSLRVIAVDAATQRTTRSAFISRSTFGGDSSVTDPYPAVTGALVTRVARTDVCTAKCAGAATVLPLTATVVVSGGAGSAPFATLRFYAIDSAGLVRLLGASASVSIDATGSQRTYTYALDYVPPAGLTGTFRVFAVGINTPGNALTSDPAGPQVRFYTNP